MGGILHVGSQRLLADNVLTGRQCGLRQGYVGGVRGADVDDVDRIVLDEVLDGGVSLFDAQTVLGAGGASGARRRDAGDLCPGSTSGSAVHLSHEPGTDEAGP